MSLFRVVEWGVVILPQKVSGLDCEPIIYIIWPITTTARSSTSTFRSTSSKPHSTSMKNSVHTSSPLTQLRWDSTSSADWMRQCDPTTIRENCSPSTSTISNLPVRSDSPTRIGQLVSKFRVISLRCSWAWGPRLQCKGADTVQRAAFEAPVWEIEEFWQFEGAAGGWGGVGELWVYFIEGEQGSSPSCHRRLGNPWKFHIPTQQVLPGHQLLGRSVTNWRQRLRFTAQ